MTEYEYNALQEALSNRLKKMKSHHEFRGSTNYQDGFKDGLLAAKSVLSQEYKKCRDYREKAQEPKAQGLFSFDHI